MSRSSITRTILLIGPQNSGKTSLFNTLTHSKYKTVNYPGSTVECTLGSLYKAKKEHSDVILIDSPGIQSLNSHTADQTVTVNTLMKTDTLVPNACKNPHLCVLVLDSSQLERQLILAKQFKRLALPTLLVISKGDLKGSHYLELDMPTLSMLTGFETCMVSTKDPYSISHCLDKMTRLLGDDPSCQLNIPKAIGNISEDYMWASAIVKTIQKPVESPDSFDLDKWALHPILAPLIFFGLMTGFFWAIFFIAAPFMDAIDTGFSFLGNLISIGLPSSLFTEFLSNGIIAGFGSFLVFTPQIFILFFIIGLLESSGYLARGAIIVDKPLAILGLSGKSFVPLLSGCACAIPAMMAARTIPNKKERFVTMFTIPLMSCSARLPVYGLLLTLLIGNGSPFKSGLALTAIYIASIAITSIIAAIVARIVGLKANQTDFDIELPLWHMPSLRNTWLNAWDQTWSFCKGAGPTIMMVSIGLWLLSSFPSQDASYIHMISDFIEPVLKPMGLDGRVGVALLLSFAAREIFVSALTLIYSLSEDNISGLIDVLQHATLDTGEALFTTGSIIGLILFFMVSMQCMATLAIARKEMGNWKAPALMTASYIALAYLLAVLANIFL